MPDNCVTGRAESEGENALTLQMVRAGVSAFQRWNPEEEEIEALVVEVYFSMLSSKRDDPDQQYSEKETAQRRDAWLQRSLNTPPKQHKAMVSERKGKRAGGKGGKK